MASFKSVNSKGPTVTQSSVRFTYMQEAGVRGTSTTRNYQAVGAVKGAWNIVSAMPLEARIAHLEGTVSQIGERLNALDGRISNVERKVDALGERLDARIDRLEAKFDGRFAEVDGRFSEMDRRFTWVIGLLIVSILSPLVQHFTLR